jgi:hypothetical protein
MSPPSPLVERVERKLDALARRMVATFVERIPMYGQLPEEQLRGEITDICRYNLAIFFRLLKQGTGPEGVDLAEITASAARRAEERVPLDAVLAAYSVGARIAFEAFQQEATPEETEELFGYVPQVMEYVETATAAVAHAYLEERQSIYGEERDARRALAEALLTGSGTEGVARRVGRDPAPSYLVLALDIGTSADEQDPGVEGTVAARRKLRRVEQAVATDGDADCLSLLGAAGGPVLIPVAEDPVFRMAAIPGLVVSLAKAAEADVTAGMSWRAGLAGVPVAGAEAAEVLRLAKELGRPPGTYRLDDVLLEYVLTRPSEAGGKLADLLAPLEGGPELVATLEGYFAADFDRRRAAAALNIHPNTLDYRLRRVNELTGLSLSTAHGLQVLGAALTARRLGREG